MPVSAKLAQYIARDFIRVNDLVPTAEADIMLLAPKLSEDDEVNKAVLDEWLSSREHVRKSPEVKRNERIDLALERSGFGPEASPPGRAKLYRVYGEELFNERMKAWRASAGTIRSGVEPNVEKSDAATVAKAKRIIDDQYAACPLNPKRVYMTEQTRLNDIARYIQRFGSKQASKAAAHFGVDLAGRELRKRA
jgi:hypothetical protein